MLKKLPPPGRSFLFPGCDRISALKKLILYKNKLCRQLEQLVSLYWVNSPIWQEIELPLPEATVAMHLIARQPARILKNNISANG
ncbi:hypothetical protein [Microcoleus vaginatus]|uniref:hypothetical protein n=1 Tax=Microcoleus vaginatus TaxID=119532 RepID=UPI001F601217